MTKKKPNIKRDIALLISVPLVLAGLLAAVVYIPQALAKPAYDFIYSTCSSYRCDKNVMVRDGRLEVVLQDLKEGLRLSDQESTRFYYYDVSEQSTRPLTVDEAKRYQLDSSSRSPDGYTLSKDSTSSGFLFWDSSQSSWTLKNGMYKRKIDLQNDSYYYNESVMFIGWVK